MVVEINHIKWRYTMHKSVMKRELKKAQKALAASRALNKSAEKRIAAAERQSKDIADHAREQAKALVADAEAKAEALVAEAEAKARDIPATAMDVTEPENLSAITTLMVDAFGIDSLFANIAQAMEDKAAALANEAKDEEEGSVQANAIASKASETSEMAKKLKNLLA